MNTSGNYANLRFPKTVRNGQLPKQFWECGKADKVSKVIFENTYLCLTFAKSFSFWIFMLVYLFLVLKSSLKRQKPCYLLYLCFHILLSSNAWFEFLVKLSKHHNNCSMVLTFCMQILLKNLEHSKCLSCNVQSWITSFYFHIADVYPLWIINMLLEQSIKGRF